MQWPQKLYEHEIAPPSETWEEIKSRVQDPYAAIGKKLGSHEHAPPETAWPAISRQLESTPAQERSIVRKLRPFAIPAAAASLLILAFQYLPIKWNMAELKHVTTAASVTEASPSRQTPMDAETATLRMGPAATGHSEAGKNTSAIPVDTHADTGNQPPQGLKTKAFQNIHNHDPKYLETCDDNMHCCRLNGKMEAFAACIRNEELHHTAGGCTRALKLWQDRMGHSNYIPAPGNFFDIIELSNSLQAER